LIGLINYYLDTDLKLLSTIIYCLLFTYSALSVTYLPPRGATVHALNRKSVKKWGVFRPGFNWGSLVWGIELDAAETLFTVFQKMEHKTMNQTEYKTVQSNSTTPKGNDQTPTLLRLLALIFSALWLYRTVSRPIWRPFHRYDNVDCENGTGKYLWEWWCG